MHVQHPGLLGWAWLLVPVLLLFLVRRRPKRVKVSTLVFFKSLAQVYRESPWLRRLKRLLALLIAAATVLVGVGALAQLVVAPEAGALRSVLIVMDGSASMEARDADGHTRMEIARRRVRERLAGLGSEVGVLLMRYDRSPEILMPTTYDRRDLLRALDQVGLRPVEGDAETALHLAGRLAGLSAPAAIWHVTDTSTEVAVGHDVYELQLPEEVTADAEEAVIEIVETLGLAERLGLPDGVALETIDVGLATPANAGITAFQLRPRPLERGQFDAFVEVHARGAGPVEVTLEVRMDGALISLRNLTIRSGDYERLLIPVEGARGAVLELRVKTAGDALRSDDVVRARIPESRPVRLLWVRDPAAIDPFTQLALMALGEEGVLEAMAAAPAAYVALDQEFDVVLFDGWLPDAWPVDTPALVMQPSRSLGPVRAAPIEGEGLPVDTLRAVDDSHPVLYGVASDRVAVTQTAVLEAGGSLAPLWTGAMGPLLVAGEVKGQKLVITAFAADRSERLGLMASYPLLLGNAIFWLTREDEDARQGSNLRTGRVVDSAGETFVWEAADGRVLHTSSGHAVTELDRLGLWHVGDRRGSAALLSKAETLLVPNEDPSARNAASSATAGLRGDLRPLLLWLLLLLLVVEAWLFHRHAVY